MMLNLINISKIITTITLIYLVITPKLFSDDSDDNDVVDGDDDAVDR